MIESQLPRLTLLVTGLTLFSFALQLLKQNLPMLK